MARERERLHVSLSLCLNVKIAHAIISDEKVGTEWICFNITDMEYHIERGRRGAGLLCLCSHSGKALTGVLLYAQVYVRVRQLVFAQTCESVCVCMCVRALEDVKCVCVCVCARVRVCVCVFKSDFASAVFRCHSLVTRGAFSLCLGLVFQHWPSLDSVSLIPRRRERPSVSTCAIKRRVDDEEKAITARPALSEGSPVWIWLRILQPTARTLGKNVYIRLLWFMQMCGIKILHVKELFLSYLPAHSSSENWLLRKMPHQSWPHCHSQCGEGHLKFKGQITIYNMQRSRPSWIYKYL